MIGVQRAFKAVIRSATECMRRPRKMAAAVTAPIALQLFVFCCLPRQIPTSSEPEYGVPSRPEPVGWVFGRVIGVSGSPSSNFERSRFTPGPVGGPQRFAPK